MNETKFYELIGESIYYHRKQRNMKQWELAEKLNLSRVSIVNIEKGRQKPTLYLLYRISQILETTLDSIINKPFIDKSLLEQVKAQSNSISPQDLAHLTDLRNDF